MSARVLLAVALAALPLQAFDDAVRAEVQSERRPWLERTMHVASDDARPALIAGVAIAALAGGAGRAFAIEAAVALVPVNLAVEASKYLTNRARPDGTHHRNNAAFPSSHAANAFAVAIVVARRWRRWTAPALLLALLVAYSRMYLDRHWFTDVAAGALAGAGLAWWAVGAWRSWRAARTAVTAAHAG